MLRVYVRKNTAQPFVPLSGEADGSADVPPSVVSGEVTGARLSVGFSVGASVGLADSVGRTVGAIDGAFVGFGTRMSDRHMQPTAETASVKMSDHTKTFFMLLSPFGFAHSVSVLSVAYTFSIFGK